MRGFAGIGIKNPAMSGFLLYGYARKIGYFLVKAGQQVKQGALPAVGIPRQGNLHITFTDMRFRCNRLRQNTGLVQGFNNNRIGFFHADS